MQSIKVTKRYLLKKQWIDADICKLIVLILAILVGAVAISYLSVPPNKRTVEKRDYSECKGDQPDTDVCTKIILSSRDNPAIASNDIRGKSDQENPTADNYKPNDFIKDSRDVAAQEGMWRATNFVAITTMRQLILGLFGLGLIWGTLIETRKVLRETKRTTDAAIKTADAAENAERAWVFISIEIKHSNLTSGKKNPDVFRLKVFAENFGKSPATHVDSHITFSVGGKLIELNPKRIEFIGPGKKGAESYLPEDGSAYNTSGASLGSIVSCRWEFSDIFQERFVGNASFKIERHTTGLLTLTPVNRISISKNS